MWTLIDEMRTEKEELGRRIQTYASQMGVIGCLIMVVGGDTRRESSSISKTEDDSLTIAFVPGAKLVRKENKWEIAVASGYGEIPQTPDYETTNT